ncbi:MAG: RNA-guided pseudouridylation complex pseudouridine synthase subunit Cbf5 [Candidatus Nanohaloarchaea archaeon]
MEWYTVEDVEPSEEFGEVPQNRDPEDLIGKGFIVVDKPFGPTSNQVSSWIREELNLRKTGHFGTLDPNATGVLPVGLEKGTRIQKILSDCDKEYVFEASFERKVEHEEVRKALKSFRGTNRQVPPEKSAVKQGEREREAHEVELIEQEEERILGRVECEAGFYVRVLVDQLAEKLDTEGEMMELRRTQQGFLEENDTNTIQEAVDAYHFWKEENDERQLREVVHPIEDALVETKKIVVKNSAVNAVANGADLRGEGVAKLQDGIEMGERIGIMTAKGELIAIAEAQQTSEKIYEGEGKVADLESVHLDPETYPKRW